MSPEYLFSVPVHILHFYIRFFNERQEEEERAMSRAAQRRNTPGPPPMPKRSR